MDMPPSYPVKTCTQCKRTLPLDEFYVKIKATGRRFSWCKDCHNNRTLRDYRIRKSPELQAEREAQRQQAAEQPKTATRTCRVCGCEKGREEFRPMRRTCRSCENVANQQYQRLYPERRVATVRRSEARPERKAYQRAWQTAHSEQRAQQAREKRERDPERGRGAVKLYRARHPLMNRVHVARRRARLMSTPGTWSEWDWERLKARYDWTCLSCGRREPDIALSFDHVVPLVLGGWNIISNGQPLCGSCNSRKHKRVVDYRPNFYRL